MVGLDNVIAIDVNKKILLSIIDPDDVARGDQYVGLYSEIVGMKSIIKATAAQLPKDNIIQFPGGK